MGACGVLKSGSLEKWIAFRTANLEDKILVYLNVLQKSVRGHDFLSVMKIWGKKSSQDRV